MTIRVLLADDHQMFREGLRAILERDSNLTIVGEASNGRMALTMAGDATAPDVIIMDIGMPGLNGVDATRQILAKRPEVKVIALSAHADRRFVTAMLEAGAAGYVLKEAASDEIRRAVVVVHRGGKYLSPEIAGTVIDDYLGNKGAGMHTKIRPMLAAREREVVQLLAEGKTSKDVAALLHISVKTVETHRRNIMGKLKVKNLASLTKFAIREGLTTTDG
jgi:DNA-binding NarL/FixJ family response regulator